MVFVWDIDDLNAEQVDAIEHEGSVFLNACPGSGKTRALTYKIALELSRLKSDKEWVVAITYTHRAAEEIEERIDSLPGVFESAVIGIPDADFGEAVTAVVVASPGYAPCEADIIAKLKTEIANFKVPKRVHVVPELPRNAMGKVEKSVLRQRYSV